MRGTTPGARRKARRCTSSRRTGPASGDAGGAPRDRAEGALLPRRRGELDGVEVAVAVAVLAVEPGRQARAMHFQGNRFALAAGQFAGREDTVAVAIH